MPDTQPNLVEIDGLRFAYGARPILAGVNMRIRRGEVVGILGTSGSGKTTLLRLMTGQLKPDAGTVRVDGKLVHQLDTVSLYALRRHMGMMFQAGGLFSDLSVFDNIAFPIREHTKLSDDVVRDLVLMKLHAVGLRGAAGLMPAELSGGMARRVALARAIAMDPMLILYDEPFAGLDPISLNVVANLIRRLNQALGATSVVVTYDVSESLKVVDRAFFLSEGVVAAEGTPQDMNTSNDPFVHQFIHAEPDGPVPFHFQAQPLRSDFNLA